MRNVIDVPYLDQSVRYPTGCESVSAVMLSLTVRIYQTYRTLDMDKLYMMMSHKKRQKEDSEQ